MNTIYTLIIIAALIFIFYEYTNRSEGFKILDKYAHLSDEEKKKKIFDNDVKLNLLYRKAKLSGLLDNNKKNINELVKECPKYKIAFVTFENRDEDYIRLHDLNVEKYCKYWGYEYIRVTENDSGMSPYWYKVLLIYNLMKTNKYDYLFWMDSDTVINNFNIDLGDDILCKYNSDIFIAPDNVKYDIINSGLFIVRNSEIGKKFMEDWLDLYLPMCENGDGKLKGVWAMSCYEQGTQNQLIFEKYSKYTTILDQNIFNNRDKCDSSVFITHYYGKKGKHTGECFRKAKH